VFFTSVNEMFSGSSQLQAAAESAVMKSFSTVQRMEQCSEARGRHGHLTDGSKKMLLSVERHSKIKRFKRCLNPFNNASVQISRQEKN